MIKQIVTDLLALSRTTKSKAISDATKEIAEHISDEEFGRALDLIQSIASFDSDAYRQVSDIVRLETSLWKGVTPESPRT